MTTTVRSLEEPGLNLTGRGQVPRIQLTARIRMGKVLGLLGKIGRVAPVEYAFSNSLPSRLRHRWTSFLPVQYGRCAEMPARHLSVKQLNLSGADSCEELVLGCQRFHRVSAKDMRLELVYDAVVDLKASATPISGSDRVLPVRPFLNIDLLFVSRLFLSPV
jgi:hypothetical protein